MLRTVVTLSLGLGVLGLFAVSKPVAISQGTAKQQTARVNVAITHREPRPEDVSSIDGIVKAYYEVISGPAEKEREWGRDATLYVPGIRFIVFSEGKYGETVARSLSHQEFVNDSDPAMKGKAFYEREVHRITHRIGNVAHVMSTAEQQFEPGGPVKGQSVDSLEMYWDGARWWIASANIWELKPGQPLPKEFLP
jgi:hypothetical protein